jgi:hypothetical protein
MHGNDEPIVEMEMEMNTTDRHQIIVAKLSDGNVQSVSRHWVTTANGAARLVGSDCQLWLTRDSAAALGGETETFWGRFPDGLEYRIKSADVMRTA